MEDQSNDAIDSTCTHSNNDEETVYNPIHRPETKAVLKNSSFNLDNSWQVNEISKFSHDIDNNATQNNPHQLHHSNSESDSSNSDSDDPVKNKLCMLTKRTIDPNFHQQKRYSHSLNSRFAGDSPAIHKNIEENHPKNLITSNENSYVQKRKRATTNIWSTVLKDEALTSDLTSVSVGPKSKKLLRSDRGAEAYDYSLNKDSRATKELSVSNKEDIEKKLNEQLNDYWNREETKEENAYSVIENSDRNDRSRWKSRNIRRYDKRNSRYNSSFKNDLYSTEHGVSNILPNLSSECTENLLQCKSKFVNQALLMVERNLTGFKDGENACNSIKAGKELAKHLNEPKYKLMVGVIDLVGGQVVLELFQKTQKIESEGGMMIKNGARRRTPGGVFLHLLREINNDPRVDPKEVKQFFAQSQKNDGSQAQRNFSRNHPQQQKVKGPQRESNNHPYKKNYKPYQRRSHNKNSSKKEDSFENELEALRKLSQKVKDKKQSPLVEQPIDMEDDDRQDITDESLKMREVKPLPDILACISKEATPLAIEKNDPTSSKSISQHDLLESCNSSTAIISGAMRSNLRNVTSQLDNFEEPEAPPNSVERVDRTISTYEDDLGDCSTEDIELF